MLPDNGNMKDRRYMCRCGSWPTVLSALQSTQVLRSTSDKLYARKDSFTVEPKRTLRATRAEREFLLVLHCTGLKPYDLRCELGRFIGYLKNVRSKAQS